jgi:hypothetical protein
MGTRKEREGRSWFYGPLLFGLFFTIFGAAALVATAVAGEQVAAGLGVAIPFLLIGAGSLVVAFKMLKALREIDEEPKLGWAGLRKPRVDLFTSSTAESVGVGDHDEILRLGRPASATIAAFRYLGRTVAHSTLAHLTIDLAGTNTIPVRDPQRVELAELVPLDRTGMLQVGGSVAVRVIDVNGAAPRVAIDWALATQS